LSEPRRTCLLHSGLARVSADLPFIRKFNCMNYYKIRYKDGRIQAIKADNYSYAREEGLIYFFHGGEHIFTVAVSAVESVGSAELPDPVHPAPIIA
jgi:hypothetical protein